MKYEILKVEDKVTPSGKKLKEMLLQGEGQSHTEARVAIWGDHPDFDIVEHGKTFDWVMEKKDSGKPIPAHPGKNYVNRTIVDAKEIKPDFDIDRLRMAFNALSDRVKVLEEKAGIQTHYPTPEEEGIDVSKSGEIPDDEIDPEDIPF